MRSRTRSASVRTFRPSHAGFAAAQRKQAGQHFDDGGFAAAVRSEEAENFSAFHCETHIVYRGQVSEFPYQSARGNRRDRAHPLRCMLPVRCSVWHRLRASLFLAQKFHVGGHSWQHAVRRVIDANFHTENLVYSFFARLYVARQKFRLLVDLFDRAIGKPACPRNQR